MDNINLRELIMILNEQNIGDDYNNVKFTDKENMQICLSESNGLITDLIDYTKSSDNYLNVLLPNATFHYMCRYTGSAGSALLDDYTKINATTSDKVKLFYYGTDPENPTQLKFYSNHDDYNNYREKYNEYMRNKHKEKMENDPEYKQKRHEKLKENYMKRKDKKVLK
jgi:hypothetical protein